VLVDNQKSLITPASVDLKRNQSHTFVFRKDGYKDDSFVITSGTSGWVWGNILIGGLIGTAVDFASGVRVSCHRRVFMSHLFRSQHMRHRLPPHCPHP
jgi:hypothetical protein